jgi:hypothetical protein
LPRFPCKLQVIGKHLLAILARNEISKGGSVLPSAQIETAGETNRTRWDHARVRLLIPIGIMVVVAIIGIAVGVLSSAQRANRLSSDNEEQAILRSLDENAERALRHLESAASMPQATTKIRDSYDANWIDRRVGEWLETFYNADIGGFRDRRGDRIFPLAHRKQRSSRRLGGGARPGD